MVSGLFSWIDPTIYGPRRHGLNYFLIHLSTLSDLAAVSQSLPMQLWKCPYISGVGAGRAVRCIKSSLVSPDTNDANRPHLLLHVQYLLYSMNCTACTYFTHGTVKYNTYCTSHTVQYVPHTMHCTIQCMLYSMDCTVLPRKQKVGIILLLQSQNNNGKLKCFVVNLLSHEQTDGRFKTQLGPIMCPYWLSFSSSHYMTGVWWKSLPLSLIWQAWWPI